MKIILSSKRHHYLARVSIFLITVALITGMVACDGGVVEYHLTITSTTGGSVTTPGEGTSTRDEGEVVNLVAEAEAEEGYRFVEWIGDVDDIADVEDAATTITMNDNYYITAVFAVKQYELTISSTEGGLVTTPGDGIFIYDCGTVVDLVAVADEGYQFVNWIGDVGTIADVNAASTTITLNSDYSITADFAVEICDWYDLDAIRDNLGGNYALMNDLDTTTLGYGELASPTANGGKGWEPIGSAGPYDPEVANLVGAFTGMLDGQGYEIRDLFINRPGENGVGLFGYVDVGGVIENIGVVNAEVTGSYQVGGLTGCNWWGGTLSNSYSTGSVTGTEDVGGLVGFIGGTVRNSYSSSRVTGDVSVGGLVGWNNEGTLSNSYYNYDEVLINGENIITIGALSDEDFEQWLANDKFLDVNERLSQEDGYYLINYVNDFKSLLAFGQNGALKFRLTKDLDLDTEPNFYIPYLAGEFDGNGHKILNLSFSFDSVSNVGLFGYLDFGGIVNHVGLENVSISGSLGVGGLAGSNYGTVSNSYSDGSVTGRLYVGGLVGGSEGTLSNSYATGRIAGYWDVGGLVGENDGGTVSNSYYNYDEVLINGENIITIGALSNEDFEQWLANHKFLDVNERLSEEDGYYVINNVGDFKELLAFGQDGSLKFRLTNDLDLGGEPNFYIPYLAGEFDGNGHKISNLRLNFDSIAHVGLFGYLHFGGIVNQVSLENVSVSGHSGVGSLVGTNWGTLRNSYSAGSVTGGWCVGGLVGGNNGTVSNSYASGKVTGGDSVGGLVGWNEDTVSSSYSTGSVTGGRNVGGLVGWNEDAVSSSFWDTETSGRSTSAGGTGKTTEEMQDIATFSGVAWDIIAVANPATRNPAYIWNIVDGQTYPFLSWQSVS